MHRTSYTGIILLLVAVVSIPCPLSSVAWADESDLAKQTQNPVAYLISIPFQNNMHFGLEPNRTQSPHPKRAEYATGHSVEPHRELEPHYPKGVTIPCEESGEVDLYLAPAFKECK